MNAHLFTGILTVAMLVVMVYDIRHYLITNSMNLLLLLLYGLAAYFLKIYWQPAMIAAGAIFAVGFLIFSLGLMGGGDIKLLAVLSLWAGWPGALKLLVLTAIAGGILVVVVLMLRMVVPPLWLMRFPKNSLPRLLTHKQPVPYGVAIAGAFLWMLLTKQVPMLGL